MQDIPAYNGDNMISDKINEINLNRLDRCYSNKSRRRYINWLVATMTDNILQDYQIIKTRDDNSVILQSRKKYKGEWIYIFILRTCRNCYRIMYRYYKGLVYGSGANADVVCKWLQDNLPKRIKPTLKTYTKYLRKNQKDFKFKIEYKINDFEKKASDYRRSYLKQILEERRKLRESQKN